MYGWPVSFVGKILERFALRFYKKCLIWTDAQSTIDELVSLGIQREQCTAIPCPISTEERMLVKKRKENKPTFLFVSRVVRMKGIEEVIKAFSFIAKERKDAKLWIVGGGETEYMNQLQSMIEEYGIGNSVVFFGKVSEDKKMDLMSRAHILLNASVREGWGLVVLEAASLGTPAVVYNVPGLRDVVKDGMTGIVLKDNSPIDLAKAALKLFADKQKYPLLQTGGKKWIDSLKWKTAAHESEGLLHKAVVHPV